MKIFKDADCRVCAMLPVKRLALNRAPEGVVEDVALVSAWCRRPC